MFSINLPIEWIDLVDLGGLEPPTSRLSGVRSNHLSYKSILFDWHLIAKGEKKYPLSIQE